MDALGGYSNLLNNINQRAVQNNQHIETKSNIEQRNDEIMKTLGEAKVFLSGKSIGEKVGQALKTRAKAAAEKYAAQAKEGVQNAINQRVGQAGSRLDQLRGGRASEEQGQEMENVNNFRGGIGSSGAPDNGAPETSFDEQGATRVEGLGERAAGKTAAEEAATEGGEEAGAGILDAIPGLDVIGVIGGAIMAGHAAHKANKQARLTAQHLQNTGVAGGTSYQAGVSG